MKIIKLILLLVITIISVLGIIDGFIAKYGQPKYYELVQGNSVVRGNFTKGILTYRGDNLSFFKWDIDSIKQVIQIN